MTTNQVPGASGVRIAGDDYQWLHVWRCCLEALHENSTGNTVNPVVAVGVEEPNVGNGDDIVLHRLSAPNTYVQVKYAVDNRTPLNLSYLDAQGVLRKLVATHTALTRDETQVEIKLLTNRTPDHEDILIAGRDSRDGRLMPRAGLGGPLSRKGKARSEWAEIAGTDEAGLLRFFDDFQLELAYDLERLRKDVSLLMTANGLRSDAAAVNLGADWISKQVIAGHRRITIEEISAAVDSMNLIAGSPWTRISISTIKRDQLASHAAVDLDWVDRIQGDVDWHRIEPAPPATWDDLASDIRKIPGELHGNKRVLVTGHFRQATGFYVGAELRRVLGFEVGIRQGDQLWTGEEPSDSGVITSNEEQTGAGSDVAIVVNVAADAAKAAAEWIRSTVLPIGKIIVVSPVLGTGPKAVATPRAANSLAIAIRDLARQNVGTGEVHLFLIGPLGLAVLLGHHWNRVARTHAYEHLGGSNYVHAFTIDA